MRIDDLKASESAKIILGTFCMVSEGFDCKCLDTLVLASPKSDVVQSVGRILREEASKRRHIPTVIDIMDGFSIFQKQAMKRLKYYKSQKYHILGDVEIAKNNKLVRLEGPCFIDLEKIDKHVV
jgi:predicted helicase